MKNWIIRKLGGYPKDEVLTQAVKHLYNTIGAEDILRVDGDDWIFEGKALNSGQKKLLASQARTLINTQLWKVLQADIKYMANKRMFVESKTEQDLIAGKIWLFTLDALKTRLNSMSRESGIFNKK